MKKQERAARARERQAQREHYERAEAAAQSFLEQCRTLPPSETWEAEFSEAKKSAGKTMHIVEWMVSVLASTQIQISPEVRRALDVLLDELGIDRRTSNWEELRQLNYGEYWRSQYGLE